MNRNSNLTPTSFLFMREDFHQEDGHSSDLDQKRSGGLGDRPQGIPLTGGGGLARVPNLRVCKHLLFGVAHAGRDG